MGAESRAGKPAVGWTRQTLTVPERMRKEFAEEADRRDSVSVKLMGTAALGVFLGMPEGTRSRFLLEITKASFDRKMEEIGAAGYYDLLIRSLVATGEIDRVLKDAGLEITEKTGETAQEPKWYVSRILDPEITPPPGQKLSDREESEQRRKSG